MSLFLMFLSLKALRTTTHIHPRKLQQVDWRSPGEQTANLLISWLSGCTSWATFLYEGCLLLQKSVFGRKMLTYLVVGAHGSNPNWSRWMAHPESGSYKGFFYLKGCFSSWLKCWLMGKLLGFSLWYLFLVQSRLLGEVTMLETITSLHTDKAIILCYSIR